MYYSIKFNMTMSMILIYIPKQLDGLQIPKPIKNGKKIDKRKDNVNRL